MQQRWNDSFSISPFHSARLLRSNWNVARRQGIEQVSLPPWRCFPQTGAPIPREPLQKSAELLEAPNLLAKRTDFLPGQGVHHAAGRPAEVALAEDAGQFGERETGEKRALHHEDSIERSGGVDAVAVCVTWGAGEHANALVVAERIRAQPGQTGQLSGTVDLFSRHAVTCGQV
jgi:hypothetical protein